MKMLGLIGGMSWDSTAVYYRLINQFIRERMGGLHSAKLLLHSFDFQEIADLQAASNWPAATDKMIKAACILKSGGAEGLVICTNTMHKMAGEIEQAAQIPVLHIVDATAKEIKKQRLGTVGLLGTCFTMEQPFYRGRLEANHGLKVLVPDREDRQEVHRVIFEELCRGIVHPASKKRFQAVIGKLLSRGAEGVILGCTEIGMLVNSPDVSAPVFDTTLIHAQDATDFALAADVHV
jgi:aspartate racemase